MIVIIIVFGIITIAMGFLAFLNPMFLAGRRSIYERSRLKAFYVILIGIFFIIIGLIFEQPLT